MAGERLGRAPAPEAPDPSGGRRMFDLREGKHSSCPQCGGFQVVRAQHRGVWDWVVSFFTRWQPYRCLHCSCRFWRRPR